MGVLLSLIALPVQEIRERRKKKKAEKIALNYRTTDAASSTQSQSQSRRLDPQQQQQQEQQEPVSTLPPPEIIPEQQQARVEEFETTLGAARVGYPMPTAGTRPTTTAASANITPSKTTLGATEKSKMASDEDYMAFLDKANQDPSVGYSAMGQKTGGKVQLKTMDEGASVPDELRMATEREEWVYVSDADEPFVAVSLTLKGTKLPDEETFAQMINHPDPSSADIAILDPVHWDSQGQYKSVIEATRKACKGGDVRVYKVALGGTRVEYWVVGVDGAGKSKAASLVGVKALAVES